MFFCFSTISQMSTIFANLKKKLDSAGAPEYIKNVYGVGYKFISEWN